MIDAELSMEFSPMVLLSERDRDSSNDRDRVRRDSVLVIVSESRSVPTCVVVAGPRRVEVLMRVTVVVADASTVLSGDFVREIETSSLDCVRVCGCVFE